MLNDLPTLVQLLRGLQQVPYLASKNIFKVANYFLMLDQDAAERLCKTILEAKKRIKRCEICCAWQEERCSFCCSPKRDKTIICVVETWQELISIENTGGYNGQYHVLGGVISPLEGITPENLSIDALVKRMNADVAEVILATNQTPEGETTAAYIANRLKGCTAKVSCLARGIPIGSSLEFMDRLTVYKALSERRLF